LSRANAPVENFPRTCKSVKCSRRGAISSPAHFSIYLLHQTKFFSLNREALFIGAQKAKKIAAIIKRARTESQFSGA
jgi:hypothetical protein